MSAFASVNHPSISIGPHGAVSGPSRRIVRPATNQKPKEHGAYAILAVPIATASVLAGMNWVASCVVIAAFAGFMAHEPLLVLRGFRGQRAKDFAESPATRLAVLLSITLFCGLAALCMSTGFVAISLIACFAMASTSFAIAWAGKHRTAAAQYFGVMALSLPCVPMLLSGGVPLSSTLAIWIVFVIGFACTTTSVRSVIAKQKGQERLPHFVALYGLTALVLISGTQISEAILSASPMVGLSWCFAIKPPPANQIRHIGWTLVLGTVATGAWLIWCGP